jgi:hypothetical protein
MSFYKTPIYNVNTAGNTHRLFIKGTRGQSAVSGRSLNLDLDFGLYVLRATTGLKAVNPLIPLDQVNSRIVIKLAGSGGTMRKNEMQFLSYVCLN